MIYPTFCYFEPFFKSNRVMRKPTFWFPTWSDTNQAVQLQKMARGLKFRIYVEEGLYYLFSENKGADQLRGYREADLHLCFRICKCWFSHDAAHIFRSSDRLHRLSFLNCSIFSSLAFSDNFKGSLTRTVQSLL